MKQHMKSQCVYESLSFVQGYSDIPLLCIILHGLSNKGVDLFKSVSMKRKFCCAWVQVSLIFRIVNTIENVVKSHSVDCMQI